jgi:hypothetical protein
MNKQSRKMLLVAVIAGSVAQCACAGIILNSPEMWSTAGSLAGWTNATPIGTQNSTLSNPSNFLRITFGDQGGVPVFEDDVIYSTNYAGSYLGSSSNLALRFSFFASNMLPAVSEIYIHNPNGDIWELAFNAVAGSWVQEDIRFNYSAGWVGPGSSSQFWSDLANIDWIGVYIVRNIDTIQQNYGIDNWEFYQVIPEPGVFSILAACLLSGAIALRKRRQYCSVAQEEFKISGHG